jgi:hypothetical protein
LTAAEHLPILAYYNDVCVGTVCCRKEADESNPNNYKVYIMTLGVLEPYRHLGLGKLKHIIFIYIIDRNTAC